MQKEIVIIKIIVNGARRRISAVKKENSARRLRRNIS